MATYEIYDLDDLQDMDSHTLDDCVLMNDIDASATRNWNQGGVGFENSYYGFKPIDPFGGTFDGQGFKITNLYINRTQNNGATDNTFVGLFSEVLRATTGGFIKDLTLENVDITGRSPVGALAGSVEASAATYLDITNVHSTGTIESTGQYSPGSVDLGIGGLVGSTDDADYVDCSSTVQITASTTLTNSQYFGGFVGWCSGGTLTDCLASGSINLDFTGTSISVGGIAGSLNGTIDSTTASVPILIDGTFSGTIIAGGMCGDGVASCTKCFSFGNVTVNSTSAALVGGFAGRLQGTMSKCGTESNLENYSADATNNATGGFCGSWLASSIGNCYAKGNVNQIAGVGHTDARIGGFVGLQNSSIGDIEYCYASGLVYSIGTPTNGGGFCGLDTAVGSETALFWDTETSGWSTTDGSATGKTTEQMKTESTFTDAGWDFDDVWYISTFTRAPGLATTIWLSASGDYDNFEEGTKDADSFSVGVPTTNVILWLDSLEALLLGTAGDEWMVGSNRLKTPISPTNFAVRPQSTYGSATLKTIKVNEVVLFIDYVRRKVREMTYSADKEKYISPDLTSLAEHITESGIVSVGHQKNPDSILWCVLADGSLISMVYARDQNVIAWSDHPIDGTVLSVCVIPSTDEDEVWISIKRTINGADKIYIERMSTRIVQAIEDSFYVDCGITVLGTSATIAGLDHLEGETVVALVDGAYDGTYTVASGQITVATTPTAKTTVGLSYRAVLQPMRVVANSQGGTSFAANTRIKELKVSFLNSLGVQYGSDDSDLYDINFEDERLEDEGYTTGLYSGDITVNMPGGFSTQNPIIISSDKPFPMIIRAMVAGFEQTGR